MQIFHCEQGTPEWFEARKGIPTASEFSTVMAEGRQGLLPAAIMDAMVKGGCTAEQVAAAVKAARAPGASPSQARLKYMRTLAGDIIRGSPEEEGYSNAHMERGKVMEDEARDFYAFTRGVEPISVGFIREGNAGCSPDSLIGETGGLEIKSAIASVQIERLEKQELPSEHKAQVQGSLWVTGREWWDFLSYAEGLPPLVVHVERDEEYIAKLATAVEKFNSELADLVERVRGYDALPVAAE